MDGYAQPNPRLDVDDADRRVEHEVRDPVLQLWRWAEMEERLAKHEVREQDVALEDRMPSEVIFGGPAGTGKTWGVMLFLLWAGRRWPGARIAICRQTRASLVQSACVTLEKILPANHEMLKGPSREHRTSYWLGPTEYYLGSLEEPTRLFSTEWDIVYVQECVELDADSWEKFGRSMRGRKMPFCVLIGDTNPGPEQHWIWKRAFQRKDLPYYFVGHRDNPALWDAVEQKWSDYAKAYLPRLRKICASEHNYKRLVLGEWTSASGAVWPEYSSATHSVTLKRDVHGHVTERELQRWDVREFYGGLDFGYNAPGALFLAGYCGDRSLVQVAEVYQRGRLQDWWGDQLVQLHHQYPLSLIFADAEDARMIDYLNDRLGVPRKGPGAIVVPIKKGPGSVQQGLDVVRRRLTLRDGGPKLWFDTAALYGPRDAGLEMSGVPTCTVEEIPLYAHRRRLKGLNEDAEANQKAMDEPDPQAHDHGCDALRYLCMGVENLEPAPKRKPELGPRAYGRLFDHDEVLRGTEYDQEMDELSKLYYGEIP